MDAIHLSNVVKTYRSKEVSFTALKDINLQIKQGEFVAIIGKSGSGKSTLLNMMTGIDLPSSGIVEVAGTQLQTLANKKLPIWRGRHVGVIFQFFQLLPTLTLLENVMLPMDLCKMYLPRERKVRAMHLLEQVEMGEHAHKLPSAVSGGQQQRVAIARALANDPPIIVADEPTGSLDSKNAESVFQLFQGLVQQGKTVVMVTHDNDLASKVQRTVIVADGEIVNQYIMHALPKLDVDVLTQLHRVFKRVEYVPGSLIIREGDDADEAYIITKGEVEVLLKHPSGQDIVVNRLLEGQYFGEIALIRGGKRTASIRAAGDEPVELMALGKQDFGSLLGNSEVTRIEMDRVLHDRLQQLKHLGGDVSSW